jgi:hypothetical protein
MTKEVSVGDYDVLYKVEHTDTAHITLLEISRDGEVQDLPMSEEIPIVQTLYKEEL